MRSWKSLVLASVFVSACAGENSDGQKEARVRMQARTLAPRPVRVADSEAEKKLAGVKLGEPRLCDESCWDRDPALFTDLDAFIKSECAEDAGACPRIAPSGASPRGASPRGDAGKVR
jgi:hypothetical protein